VLISSVKLDEKALLGYGADMLDEATLRRLVDHGVSLVTADFSPNMRGFAYEFEGSPYYIVVPSWEDESQRRRTIRHELWHIIHDFPMLSPEENGLVEVLARAMSDAWAKEEYNSPRERRAREAEEEAPHGSPGTPRGRAKVAVAGKKPIEEA
jgi:hypothetical protein